MNFDLHTHTTASDGLLNPSELISAAKLAGIETLALTDHDTVAGYLTWSQKNIETEINVVPGIEFSTTWNGVGIHILGLNIDPLNEAITNGIIRQLKAREERALKIIENLNKAGLDVVYDELILSAGTHTPGRPHIANYLVQKHLIKDQRTAFKKYLGAGKIGDVKNLWSELSEIIDWIRGSNGTAVLAHPNKYNLTYKKLSLLTDDFVSLGGQGLEVISGKQHPETTRKLAMLCTELNILASRGSDFHEPGQPWAELGNIEAIPIQCKPVWDSW
jgi:3',5'-nucleoside bisphosphate phosphatase